MTQASSPTLVHDPAVEYEPTLVEEAVRYALDGGSSLPSARLLRLRYRNHRQLENLYQLAHGEVRESAFREHYWQLFRALELDQVLAKWLDKLPQLSTNLERILIRSARSRRDEGAELWESRERRGQGIPAYLVVAVQPCDLSESIELGARLLPSLERAADRVGSADVARDPGGSHASQEAINKHCPLCRFPTSDWADDALVAEISAAVTDDFPDWRAAERCCGHCAERYLALSDPTSAPSPY